MDSRGSGNAIKGRNAFLALLKDEGVSHMFGNPGTTELPIMHALRDEPDLTYVLGLQEAIVVAMADGFSRASGQPVACNVHVAPGLGNALGALYTARDTGTPIILTAGQQEQGHGLTEPLLYGPLVPMAAPLVKWAVEVTRIEDLPRIIRRAAKIATTPPTGPVFISLPGDILNDEATLDLGQRTRIDTSGAPGAASLRAAADLILAAKNPMIVAGHEVVASDAFAEVAAFADALGAPVMQQSVPHGAHFPSEHPCFIGGLGRDQPQVREILEPHDLLICLGCDPLRMSVYHETDPLPPGTKIMQIGLDDWQMGKNYSAEMALRSDLKDTLQALTPLLLELGGDALQERAQASQQALSTDNWTARRIALLEQTSAHDTNGPLHADRVMMQLAAKLPDNAIIVDEGITSSRALNQFVPFRDRHCFFGNVSGGIGWGIAAATGVQMAKPERRVVAVIGDGSAMYSIQALWTAAHFNLPIVYIIANNGGYKILKQRLLAFHGNDDPIAMDFRDPPIDICSLAKGFGVPAERVESAEALDLALDNAFAQTDGPRLIEVSVQP